MNWRPIGFLLAILLTVFVVLFEHNLRTQAAVPASLKVELNSKTIFVLVNKERSKAGLATLADSPALDASAAKRCQDMIQYDYFAHVNPKTGQSYDDFITTALPHANYRGENINLGPASATNKEHVERWMASAGHKANILKPAYTLTGVAVCKTIAAYPYQIAVVQEFASL